jgi:hypothetical protein
MPTLHEQYNTYSIDQILQALENTAMPGTLHYEYLKNLLSVRTTEMVSKQLCETAATVSQCSARIEKQITSVTTALSQASSALHNAGSQSGTLGRRLNWLTAVIAFAALISAVATAFYALETKRQVDLMQQQFQRFVPQVPTNSTTASPGH